MKDALIGLFTPVVRRVIAAGVAAGAGVVASKTGVAIGADCQGPIAEAALGGVMLAVYGIFHVKLPVAPGTEPAKQ